jgi:hypothetical protein
MVETLTAEGNPRILAAQFRVKYRDIFNIEQLYKMVHEWLRANQWKDIQSNFEGDQHESFYMDKAGLYGEKEIWVWWRLWQWPDADPGDSANSFYKFHMDIDFNFKFVSDFEIMQQGKKVKTNKGEVEVRIWAWIEMDYAGKWSSHPILRFFLNTFRLRVFEGEIDKHKYRLYKDAFILQSEMKKFLGLRGIRPEIRETAMFHPPKGMPEEVR